MNHKFLHFTTPSFLFIITIVETLSKESIPTADSHENCKWLTRAGANFIYQHTRY